MYIPIDGVSMTIKLKEYSKNKIRSEMKVRGITTKDMCILLNERLGINLQAQSFNNKISRSDFKTTFFFECMYAMNVKHIQIEIDEIEFNTRNDKTWHKKELK